MIRFKFLLTAILLFALKGADAQKNIVTNGGFEDEFYGWNNNGAQLTPYDFKGGRNSCAIVIANTDKWVGIDQAIHLPKKAKELELSAWLKTVNVVKGRNDWDGAIFTAVFLDANDKEMGDGVNVARLTGYQDWSLYKKQIKIPERAAGLKIMVAMGNASGTMIVDDVSVKATE